MLVTLVIIGVIAALTIPNLLQKYQEQTTVKKVQKFYSNLSNAYNLVVQENGPAGDWIPATSDREKAEKIYEIVFKPHFKIAKDCGVTNTGNCIKSGYYKALNDTTFNASGYSGSTGFYKLLLDDGSAVITYALGTGSSTSLIFIYDTNGIKGPNKMGVDTFWFFSGYVGINKISPFGLPSIRYYSAGGSCKRNEGGTSSGQGCAAWVIYKGNMDYLHCDDLSWTGKDKCK